MATGNPGVIDFYHPFLTAIRNQDRSGALAILSHSHIGHDPTVADLAPAHHASSNYALPFQIRNSLRIFDALSTYFGVNTRTVIVGHSVGSWVALQVPFPKCPIVLPLQRSLKGLETAVCCRFWSFLPFPDYHQHCSNTKWSTVVGW
jgi:hypothetical protein